MFIFGCSVSNHFGKCPQVTKCILFTHGANFSTLLNQYCKLSQSLYLISFLSPLLFSCFCFSFCHSGSFPSTHNITKSIFSFLNIKISLLTLTIYYFFNYFFSISFIYPILFFYFLFYRLFYFLAFASPFATPVLFHLPIIYQIQFSLF